MTIRYDRIELRHLRYFLACAEAGSLRRAADAIGMAQPPLGRQIKHLEEELGVRLFARSSTGLVLTEAGRQLQLHAIEILERLRFAADETRMSDRGIVGNLSLGYVDDFLYGVLPVTVSAFHARFARVELHMELSLSHPVIASVLDGRLDLGFAILPLPATASRLAAAPFLPIPLFAALPVNHRLAGQAQIQLKELEGETMIWASRRPDSGFYQQVGALLQAAHITPRVVTGVFPSDMIVNLIAAGCVISLLTRESIWSERQDVVLVPFDDPAVSIHRVMIWDPQRMRSEVSAFLEVCRETMAASLAKPLPSRHTVPAKP